eukprot:scaffold84645_cov63-Attheya_sp.AAC.1
MQEVLQQGQDQKQQLHQGHDSACMGENRTMQWGIERKGRSVLTEVGLLRLELDRFIGVRATLRESKDWAAVNIVEATGFVA